MSKETHGATTRNPVNMINLLASLSFLCGSTLFLPQLSAHATIGVYLFMLGSVLMLIDTLRIRVIVSAVPRRQENQ